MANTSLGKLLWGTYLKKVKIRLKPLLLQSPEMEFVGFARWQHLVAEESLDGMRRLVICRQHRESPSMLICRLITGILT